jgi:hypothetical protein
MRKRLDITGQRFGRLVAVQVADKDANGLTYWHCRCDCANTCTVHLGNLRSSHTRSCGCLVKELPGGPPKHGYTRNGRRHPLYRTWASMRSRCFNPNNPRFKDWGGRGIAPCKRWDDFSVYLNDILTSIGPRPPGKVLDRIDNSRGYEPGNVKWSTQSESNRNRRPLKTKVGHSGFKGVKWNKARNKYVASIWFQGKAVQLKYCETAREAATVYDYVARRVFGEFALTNKHLGLMNQKL